MNVHSGGDDKIQVVKVKVQVVRTELDIYVFIIKIRNPTTRKINSPTYSMSLAIFITNSHKYI